MQTFEAKQIDLSVRADETSQAQDLHKPKADEAGASTNPGMFRAVLSTLIRGFLAGFMVSVGGTVYLNTDSRYLGAALFSIGLFVIFSYGFDLYTGKIGYSISQNRKQNLLLIPTWFGNLLGALCVGFVLHFTRIYKTIAPKAFELCEAKLADHLFSILLLSFFCGVLMFIAADGFKNAVNTVQKYLAVVLPIMVFILSGFEHCVANMFYFTVAESWDFKTVWYLIVMTAGNSLGGLLIPLLRKGISTLRG